MSFIGKKVLPDFVVIGAQKCASTSLLSYIGQHSRVRLGRKKSTHYFDLNPSRGADWYAAHFPRHLAGLWGGERDWLTGESCPSYMFLPEVPARMAALMPHVKLIAILRDPVKRLVSQYHHEKRKGRAAGDFASFIAPSLELGWPVSGPVTEVLQKAAVPRGFYADQLRHWQNHFPRQQILAVSFEELLAKPDAVMGRIFTFLGLEPEAVDTSRVLNKGTGAADEPLDPALLERLGALYRSRNAQLAQIISQQAA